MIEGEENLVQHATSYYKELFGPAEGNAFPLDSNMWKEGEKVSAEDNTILVGPFSEEEVKKALFMMEKKQRAC